MREIVFLFLGGIVGHIVGWIVAVGWAMLTGNLMMPEPEYRRKELLLSLIVNGIIVFCTALGAFIGWIGFGRQSRRRWFRSHEYAPRTGGRREAMPQFFKRRVRLILIGLAAIVASFFLLNWWR